MKRHVLVVIFNLMMAYTTPVVMALEEVEMCPKREYTYTKCNFIKTNDVYSRAQKVKQEAENYFKSSNNNDMLKYINNKWGSPAQKDQYFNSLMAECSKINESANNISLEESRLEQDSKELDQMLNNLKSDVARFEKMCKREVPDNEYEYWVNYCTNWESSLNRRITNHQDLTKRYCNDVRDFNSMVVKHEKRLDDLEERVTKWEKDLLAFINDINRLEDINYYKKCLEEKRYYEKMLEDRRKKVKVTQEALRRLNRDIQGNKQLLDEWEKTTEETVESAMNHGKDILINNLGDIIALLGGDLKNFADKDAVETLESLLEDEELKRVVKNLNEVKEAIDKAHWSVEVTEFEYYKLSFENAYNKFVAALENPKIQKALTLGRQYAKYATYAKIIVDSAYNITAELYAWKRIDQMNKNSEECLKAVKELQKEMEKNVNAINETKAILEKLQCGETTSVP